MDELPLVSICIPNYNHAKFLASAIRSALGQTYQNIEVIVLDNASTDNSIEVASEFLKEENFRLKKHDQNIGFAANWSSAFSEAKGQFVQFLCADDALDLNIVRSKIDVINSNPKIVLVSSAMTVIDENGTPVDRIGFHAGEANYEELLAITFKQCSNLIGGPSNFMVSRAVGLNNPFDPEFKYLSDLDFALRCLRHGNYFGLSQVGVEYRRHENTITKKECPEHIQIRDWINLPKSHNRDNHKVIQTLARRYGTKGLNSFVESKFHYSINDYLFGNMTFLLNKIRSHAKIRSRLKSFNR